MAPSFSAADTPPPCAASSSFLRQLALGIARAWLVAAIAFALVLGAGWLAIHTDANRLRANIARGIANGAIPVTDTPDPHGAAGIHPLNECLIYLMVGLRSSDRFRNALSPLAPIEFRNDSPKRATGGLPAICPKLRAWALTGRATFPVAYYDRYLHGHRLLATLTVLTLGARRTRVLLTDLCYMLVIGLVFVNLAGIPARLGRRMPSTTLLPPHVRHLSFAVIGLWLLCADGMPAFAPLLSHAPSMILLFVLLLLGGCLDWQHMPIGRMEYVMAAFGTLTCIFEFLIGSLPLMAGAVLLIVGCAVGRGSWRQEGRRPADAMVAFGTGFLAILVIKQIVVVAVDPDEFFAFMQSLAVRMGSRPHDWGVAQHIGLRTVMDALRWKLDVILPLPERWRYVIVLATAAQGVVSILVTVRARRDLMPLVLFTLSAAMPLLWYPLFPDHTVEHARFMVRMLVWPMGMASVLMIVALHATLSARASTGDGVRSLAGRRNRGAGAYPPAA